ncbi:TIGR00156 family protein [Rodentibacter caecimuris]|uniref:TIGR00156 family protein n=1 Tax=Rodentibacter caecimuris TaxID=1796644 RepID=A0A9X8W0L5_9PAST|nr:MULTISPECIES: YgiW/YdeI family stress tolerance OB fold protein [Pasteurellaceae]AOF54363.1 Protein ygiW precursor [Pasteurellaceae bacterium NI1060]MCQ9122829.1 YgiW/YdeI family stress tolerance OB fold protein [Rodentibacter heylii]MCR1837892.1 YgiW/YdeI family stress tolerance OB fold protein [Pasteurella caecimuris]MCU0106357.1 YgiW/YdeI family stress tolerance OB fold protein [Pasteurella caecimuris]MCX2960214.1 YgiW/YdeI family stress tolerance OB fold protein [Rodentibacter heylii]
MKKLTLATLLAIATSTAFAGFNGNGNTVQGGFKQSAMQAISVKQALSEKDNSMVTLVGSITQQIGKDDYLFTDGSAQIKVEIKDRVWNGLNVGPQDNIRISGKLDNDAFEKAEVEVYSIEKVN